VSAHPRKHRCPKRTPIFRIGGSALMGVEEKLGVLPDGPGVYLMRDSRGKVIYVGKALSLRKRVRSYFQADQNHTPRVQVLVRHIDNVEYIATDSEIEALILECNLIKQYKPRYNVKLKDDKSYPYLKITNEEFPRLFIVRRRLDDGASYYGPYTDVKAVRRTMRFLRKVFPVRTCNKEIDASSNDRPCLNYHIHKCLAPCDGKIDARAYNEIIDEIRMFLEGRHDELIPSLQKRMQAAAKNLEFERAARIRDHIRTLEKMAERQKVAIDSDDDQDVIGCAVGEEGSICVQIFFVRSGKLVGRDHFQLESEGDTDASEVLTAFLEQYYSQASFIPKSILLHEEVENMEVIGQWLSDKRGQKVYLHVPQRGQKRRLVDMVRRNAELVAGEIEARRQHKHEQHKQALLSLQELIGTENLPERIEGYDISNTQGTEAVGSMVVFNRGEADNSEYRRFKIHSVEGPNDYAMMAEVVRRRFLAARREQDDLEQAEDSVDVDTRFTAMPNLILVDGGKGQLNTVLSTLESLGIDNVPVISLAKKEEEVFVTGESESLELDRNSPALKLLMRIRDEAHRFAITYHRRLQDKKTTRSGLDDIPGVGPKRKKLLIRQFGSERGVREAGLDQLYAVPGLPRSVAEKVYEQLHR